MVRYYTHQVLTLVACIYRKLFVLSRDVIVGSPLTRVLSNIEKNDLFKNYSFSISKLLNPAFLGLNIFLIVNAPRSKVWRRRACANEAYF